METTNTTATDAQDLVRPREGRMVAGVSQGLADRFGINVLVFRALFVVLTLTSGLGIPLYAAGWFLIRSEDEARSPAERLFSTEPVSS